MEVFSCIYFKNGMGRNPAQVNIKTRELFVNPVIWERLPESFRRFLILHEEGHLKGGPNGTPAISEFAADMYAFRQYKNTEPNSLKKSVFAIDALLGNSPEQTKRKLLVYSAALLEDWSHNKNEQALVEYHNVKSELEQYHNVTGMVQANSDTSNWIGAAIGAVMTIVGYGVKANQDGKVGESIEETEALALGNFYESWKANANAKEASLIQSATIKYTILIFIVLAISGVIIYKIKKK